ncbi:MAG: hypothetical protein IKN72_08485 [Clostridia bacterium]|nr:hypothetical protein [Clostridia bacterium]
MKAVERSAAFFTLKYWKCLHSFIICGIVKEPNIQLNIPMPEACIFIFFGKNTGSRFSCFGLWKLNVWRQLSCVFFGADSFDCRTFLLCAKGGDFYFVPDFWNFVPVTLIF